METAWTAVRDKVSRLVWVGVWGPGRHNSGFIWGTLFTYLAGKIMLHGPNYHAIRLYGFGSRRSGGHGCSRKVGDHQCQEVKSACINQTSIAENRKATPGRGNPHPKLISDPNLPLTVR